MFANPNWFKRRKYGWGIRPKTWQGWVYVLIITFTLLAAVGLGHLFEITKLYQSFVFAGLVLFFIVDALSIAWAVNMDEREIQHEAIAERNASWFINLLLCFAIVYQIVLSIWQNELQVDPFIVIAVIGGSIVKVLSFWYLRER